MHKEDHKKASLLKDKLGLVKGATNEVTERGEQWDKGMNKFKSLALMQMSSLFMKQLYFRL